MSESITGDGKADRATFLAEERTLIASDRTLMAWVRTSLSMVSFGFTIYKFMQAFTEAEHLTVARPNAPRNLGLALITVGTVALMAAIIQHIGFTRQLRMSRRPAWSLPVIVASFVALIGMLTLAGILLRTGPF